jgi:GNAT superfamily N-acetyltransferase
MPGFTLRPATSADIETICAHRRAMFFDMGHCDDALLAAMAAALTNILNVYAEQAFRRHGLALQLVETALAWCGTNGIRTVILHTSEDGRPLYDRLGFRPTNEMRLVLE